MAQPVTHDADFSFEIDNLRDSEVEIAEELDDVLLPRGGGSPSARCN